MVQNIDVHLLSSVHKFDKIKTNACSRYKIYEQCWQFTRFIASRSLTPDFSNSFIIHNVIIQPRHANFVTCMLSETLVKHCNDALSMSFIYYQTLEGEKASNCSELISWFNENMWLFDNMWKIREYFHFLLFLRRDWEAIFLKLVHRVSWGFPNSRKQ